MKKIILLTGAILMISTVANACGGTTIKSGKYCLSKHTMNWYSAYAWCQAQGMELIDIETACGSLKGCSALYLTSAEQEQVIAAGGNVGAVWTNTSYDAPTSYDVYVGNNGKIGNNPRTTPRSALCQ